MGDIGEGAAVHDSGGAFQRLYQVGVDGVLQKSSHSAVCLQVAGKYGLSIIGISYQDITQTLFQVFTVFCQAQNCHNLAGHRDDEAVLTGDAVDFSAKAYHDIAQCAVIHIHAAPDDNAALVNAQYIALMHVVVQHSAQQVVSAGNGVHVAGKVQVDVFHGEHLRITAAGSAALNTKNRSQRGFTQGDNSIFADFFHSLSQADRSSGFPLAGGSGVDCRYQNQFSIGTVFQTAEKVFVDLGLITAIRFQLFFVNSQFLCNFCNRNQFCVLCDFDVAQHAFFTSHKDNRAVLHCPFCISEQRGTAPGFRL